MEIERQQKEKPEVAHARGPSLPFEFFLLLSLYLRVRASGTRVPFCMCVWSKNLKLETWLISIHLLASTNFKEISILLFLGAALF